MTWASRIHRSPGTAVLIYPMAYNKHTPGECTQRQQSRIGILIRLFKNGRISFPVISPTRYIDCHPQSGIIGQSVGNPISNWPSMDSQQTLYHLMGKNNGPFVESYIPPIL